MVKIETGRFDLPFSELASEYGDLLWELYADPIARNSSKTPYSQLQMKLNGKIQLDGDQRQFLQIFADNDFSLLKELITATPEMLQRLAVEILAEYDKIGSLPKLNAKSKAAREWKAHLEDVFGYSRFEALIGRETMMGLLGIEVCPYCNIQLLMNLPGAKGSRRNLLLLNFDHFFPKSQYPWFALSFYNLIPSCLLCNQPLKGNAVVSLSTHLHPYHDNFHNNARFFTLPDIQSLPCEIDEICLEVGNCSKEDMCRTERTIELFRLKDLYAYFTHEVLHLLDDYRRLNPSRNRYENLSIQIEGQTIAMEVTQSDIDRIQRLHRIPKRESDIRNIPLGKLKSDIWERLNGRNPNSLDSVHQTSQH